MLKDPDGGNIKIARRIATRDFLKFLENKTNLRRNNKHFFYKLLKSKFIKRFLLRDETVIVEVNADPTKGGRGFSDPYSGVVTSFDYRYCRNVTSETNILKRDVNLVFVCLHKNATSYFEKILKNHFESDTLESYFPNIKISWSEKEGISELYYISKRLARFKQTSLKKELKIFFYFCDLIIFLDNLFLGYPSLKITF